MAEVKGLAEDNQLEVSEDIVVEPVKDSQGRSYATGKRKESVARVWLKAGTGKIIINKRSLENYFPRPVLIFKSKNDNWKCHNGANASTWDFKY